MNLVNNFRSANRDQIVNVCMAALNYAAKVVGSNQKFSFNTGVDFIGRISQYYMPGVVSPSGVAVPQRKRVKQELPMPPSPGQMSIPRQMAPLSARQAAPPPRPRQQFEEVPLTADVNNYRNGDDADSWDEARARQLENEAFNEDDEPAPPSNIHPQAYYEY